MTRTCIALTFVVVSSAGALGVTAAVDQALPYPTENATIRTPMATVCQDGAIWLYWLQSPRRPAGAAARGPSETELQCKLFDRGNGRILLQRGVLRWVDPDMFSRTRPAYACATPDGDAVVLLRRGSEYSESLLVILIGRAGAVDSTTLAVELRGGAGWLATRAARRESGMGTFHVCFAPGGTMHCFFWSGRMLTHVEASTSGGHIEVIRTESFYPFGAPGTEPHLDMAALRLTRLASPPENGAVFFTAPDAIAAVFTDHPRTTDRILAGKSTDIVVYRFAYPSLVLCDSSRIPCGEAAGIDWPAACIASALVAKTKDGWVFFVPATGRTESYNLSTSGLPLAGDRGASEALSFEPTQEYVTETVDFLWLGGGKPRHIEWSGVDTAGRLHTEVLVRDQEPGRQD